MLAMTTQYKSSLRKAIDNSNIGKLLNRKINHKATDEDDYDAEDCDRSNTNSSTDSKFFSAQAEVLWNKIEPQLIARLLGVNIPAMNEEETKLFLQKKKVWPYYYPDPNDKDDLDRFPIELAAGFSDNSKVSEPEPEEIQSNTNPIKLAFKNFSRRFS